MLTDKENTGARHMLTLITDDEVMLLARTVTMNQINISSLEGFILSHLQTIIRCFNFPKSVLLFVSLLLYAIEGNNFTDNDRYDIECR